MAPGNSNFVVESKPICYNETDLEKDYGSALIHLAWCIHDGKRHLIFGMIECYPSEITGLCSSNEQTIMIRQTQTRLFYIRKQLGLQEAIEMYKTCFKEQHIPIPWDRDNKGKGKSIFCGEMRSSLAWPNLGLALTGSQSDFPFIPSRWGTVRIHQQFSIPIAPQLRKLLEYENPVKWLEERLMLNLKEHEDLIGSIHLILPNPVYRKLDYRLIPGKNKSPDKVQLEFCLRTGKTTQGLELYSIEKLNELYTGAHKVFMHGETVVLMQQSGTTDNIATLVRCEKRGILDYHPFAGFIRQINVNIDVATREKYVLTPNPNDSYIVTEYETLSQFNACETEHIPEMELGKKLAQKKLSRQQAQLASKLDQKIFSGAPDEAREYIRELLQQAREKVIIVDPYFSTVELFNFACACDSKVSIQIITSAKALQAASDLENLYQQKKSKPPKNKGLELYRQIPANPLIPNIKVLVMRGESPVIHDRFLIIDNEVWLSGNSLNNLGKRLSTMIKLPNPQPLLDEISEILQSDRITTLADWASNQNVKTTK